MSLVKRSLAFLLLCFATFVHADTSQVFGDYEVHYSVFPTAFLQPEVAQAYGVVRADDRALVTVVVTDRETPLAGGLPATITGTRTDLIQRHDMAFIPVEEQQARYFISEFRFKPNERWIFDIRITPENSNRPLDIHFEKRFEPAE